MQHHRRQTQPLRPPLHRLRLLLLLALPLLIPLLLPLLLLLPPPLHPLKPQPLLTNPIPLPKQLLRKMFHIIRLPPEPDPPGDRLHPDPAIRLRLHHSPIPRLIKEHLGPSRVPRERRDGDMGDFQAMGERNGVREELGAHVQPGDLRVVHGEEEAAGEAFDGGGHEGAAGGGVLEACDRVAGEDEGVCGVDQGRGDDVVGFFADAPVPVVFVRGGGGADRVGDGGVVDGAPDAARGAGVGDRGAEVVVAAVVRGDVEAFGALPGQFAGLVARPVGGCGEDRVPVSGVADVELEVPDVFELLVEKGEELDGLVHVELLATPFERHVWIPSVQHCLVEEEGDVVEFFWNEVVECGLVCVCRVVDVSFGFLDFDDQIHGPFAASIQ